MATGIDTKEPRVGDIQSTPVSIVTLSTFSRFVDEDSLPIFFFLVSRPIIKYVIASKHLVRATSVTLAHQIVRKIHMTYFHEESYGTKYPIRASIVY